MAAPLSAVVLTAGPAAAATVVHNQSELSSAWQTATSIQFANDIPVDCSLGQFNRNSTNGDVVVDGQGHTLSLSGVTCQGVAALAVFSGTDNVTIQNLTITATGVAGGGSVEQDGGTGNLTLNSVTMTGNQNNGGGAVEVTTDVTLTIQNSTLMNNSSCLNGGAIETNSDANTVISGSTIANNQTNSDGGAIAEDGDGSVTVTNSTITGNSAARVGGLEVDGGNLTLTYVTNVNNTTGATLSGCALSAGAAPGPGGSKGDQVEKQGKHDQAGAQATSITPANVRVDQQGGEKLTTFASTIDQPHGGPNCGDFTSGLTAPLANTVSQGFNFADDLSCGLTGTGDSQATTNDPKLGALADNGGRNPTLLPQTGSPLINLVPLASCQAGQGITIDERMLPRPDPVDVSGPGCDTGAVEIQLPVPIVIAPRFTG